MSSSSSDEMSWELGSPFNQDDVDMATEENARETLRGKRVPAPEMNPVAGPSGTGLTSSQSSVENYSFGEQTNVFLCTTDAATVETNGDQASSTASPQDGSGLVAARGDVFPSTSRAAASAQNGSGVVASRGDVFPSTSRSIACASPSSISSQGSGNSIDFLDRQSTKMSRNLEREAQKQVLMSQKMALSKAEQRLFENFVRDPGFRHYQRELLKSSLKSFCISKGVNPQDAQKLQQRMEAEDTTLLFARLGKLFMDQLTISVKTEAVPLEQLDTAVEPTAPITSPTGGESPDNMDYRVAAMNFASIPVPSFSQAVNPGKRSSPSSHLPEELLEHAYDIAKREKDRVKYLDKAGQKMFNSIFTEDEKLNCTFGGKNGKKPFDPSKVRLLNRVLAWLLFLKEENSNTPRTYENFQKDRENNDRRLSNDDEATMNKKVLTEHAYRYRSKNKK